MGGVGTRIDEKQNKEKRMWISMMKDVQNISREN